MDSSQNRFKILSLDGGGVRGIYSACLLNLIEEKIGISIFDAFDLVVGTSAGSIVAASVAINGEMRQLAERYESCMQTVFKSKPYRYGLFGSKYKIADLEKELKAWFQETKLGEVKKPLIINATNVSTGRVHVFKSAYQHMRRNGDYIRDGEIPLYKAVLASCAAPAYFDPVCVSDDLICDGGLWANNPSMVGYVDAVSNFQQDPANVRIFSVGSGQSTQFYSRSPYWGLLTGWKRSKIVDFAMSCQTMYADNCMNLILGDNIFRMNPIVDNWNLDDCKAPPTLISLAALNVTNEAKKIRKFLEVT